MSAPYVPSTEWVRIMVGYAKAHAIDRTLSEEAAQQEGYEWFDRWLAQHDAGREPAVRPDLEHFLFRASGMPELYAETVMRQDVPELVAEIRRLEGLVTAAREIAWKRWDHLSFGLLRDRLRRALGGERPVPQHLTPNPALSAGLAYAQRRAELDGSLNDDEDGGGL